MNWATRTIGVLDNGENNRIAQIYWHRLQHITIGYYWYEISAVPQGGRVQGTLGQLVVPVPEPEAWLGHPFHGRPIGGNSKPSWFIEHQTLTLILVAIQSCTVQSTNDHGSCLGTAAHELWSEGHDQQSLQLPNVRAEQILCGTKTHPTKQKRHFFNRFHMVSDGSIWFHGFWMPERILERLAHSKPEWHDENHVAWTQIGSASTDYTKPHWPLAKLPGG